MIGRALVACEESQAVCIALRLKGWEAYSCDILPCSGGAEAWHIHGDVIQHLREVPAGYYDLIISFPECTFLTVSNTYITRGCSKYTAEEAIILRKNAIEFFMFFANYPCKLKAIENPIGIMSGLYRKPDQIIQPWEFGHDASKSTCLWLFGLPLLQPTKYADFTRYRCRCGYVFPEEYGKYGCANCGGESGAAKPIWGNQTPTGQNKLGPSADRAKIRSKTYPGIAQAMAQQWTDYYIKEIIGI